MSLSFNFHKKLPGQSNIQNTIWYITLAAVALTALEVGLSPDLRYLAVNLGTRLILTS